MARMINVTTGDETARFGFRGTDLGYFVPTRHGYVQAYFGDTFDGDAPGSSGWRSPVMLRTSNRDLDNGLKWDNASGGDPAKEIFNYRHIDPADVVANGRQVDAFTIIPNDGIHLLDGRYMASGFRVIDWQHDPEQSMCHTASNMFFYTDQTHADSGWRPGVRPDGSLYEWKKSDPIGFLFQNVTMVMTDPTGETDPFVYIFGTPEGRHTGPRAGVYLRRVHWGRMWDDSAYEFWGWRDGRWQWGADVFPTPILKPSVPGATIGEINAQIIEGRVVLAYCDGMIGAVTRTAPRPDAVWTNPQLHATHVTAPAMYAPSVHPYSTLDAPYMHLSQWHTDHPAAGTFYGTKFWSLDPLDAPALKNDPSSAPAVGDVTGTVDDDSVEGTTTPTCTDLSALTVGELVDVLTDNTTVDRDELIEALRQREN